MTGDISVENRIIDKTSVVSQIYGMLRTYLHILPIEFDLEEPVDDFEPDEKVRQKTALQSTESLNCNNTDFVDMSFQMSGSGVGETKTQTQTQTKIKTEAAEVTVTISDTNIIKINCQKGIDTGKLNVEGDMKEGKEDEMKEFKFNLGKRGMLDRERGRDKVGENEKMREEERERDSRDVDIAFTVASSNIQREDRDEMVHTMMSAEERTITPVYATSTTISSSLASSSSSSTLYSTFVHDGMFSTATTTTATSSSFPSPRRPETVQTDTAVRAVDQSTNTEVTQPLINTFESLPVKVDYRKENCIVTNAIENSSSSSPFPSSSSTSVSASTTINKVPVRMLTSDPITDSRTPHSLQIKPKSNSSIDQENIEIKIEMDDDMNKKMKIVIKNEVKTEMKIGNKVEVEVEDVTSSVLPNSEPKERVVIKEAVKEVEINSDELNAFDSTLLPLSCLSAETEKYKSLFLSQKKKEILRSENRKSLNSVNSLSFYSRKKSSVSTTSARTSGSLSAGYILREQMQKQVIIIVLQFYEEAHKQICIYTHTF